MKWSPASRAFRRTLFLAVVVLLVGGAAAALSRSGDRARTDDTASPKAVGPTSGSSPSRTSLTSSPGAPTTVAGAEQAGGSTPTPTTAAAAGASSGLGASGAGEVSMAGGTPNTGFEPLLLPGAALLLSGLALRRSLRLADPRSR